MTETLREAIESLRAVAPALNSAAQEAGQVIQEVDRLLEELGVGLTVRTHPFEERHCEEQGQLDCTEFTRLAYGRIGGKMRIHVLTTIEKQEFNDEAGEMMWKVVESSRLAWSSCPREVKLKSFARLPELIEKMATGAERLVDNALKVSKIIRGNLDAGAIQAPSEAPTPAPKKGRASS